MLNYVCLRKNEQLFFTKTHWSLFKYNYLLDKLNVYKNPGKEHQVVDFWVTDVLSASEILFWKYLQDAPLIQRNYEKLKMRKVLWFTVFCVLNAQ